MIAERFQKLAESALFLPCAKDAKSLLRRGGFSCFSSSPIRKPSDGGGVFAESLGKSYPWAVGLFSGNTEISLELWNIISGISEFDD